MRRSVKIDLFPDTGGYALVNVYQAASGDYVIRTEGNHSYVIARQDGSLTAREEHTPSRHQPAANDEFIGAFDFDQQRAWRFIHAAERAERNIGQVYLRE